MGAALTYARRYALFTLVGIAGEDDLDAPDLGAGGNSDTKPGLDIQTSPKPVADELPSAPSGAGRKGKVIRPPRIVLATDQSEALRERLVAELSDLKSADEAADWVHKNLPAKNTLTLADAETVEASFRERLAAIEAGQVGAGSVQAIVNSGDRISARTKRSHRQSPRRPLRQRQSSDDAALRRKPFAYVTRSTANSSPRNPASSAAARLPKAHHIRFAQPRALGRKVSDEYTVPVCRVHHRELHRYGDEASWWAGVSIDPLPIALELWRRSKSSHAS